MAQKNITLRLVAYSDAAGKYDPSAPMNGNEDNFFVDNNLGNSHVGGENFDRDILMSPLGCVMAVADGMGGQNAGEVAAEIAIDTVSEYFAPERLSEAVAATPETRAAYLREIIVEADRRVKEGQDGHPDRSGMGSTLIISWISGDSLTVGWIGDSRTYLFNPVYGLKPVSHDHTYVQELADKGIITYEDTFGHPQGNIVTRSLGDPDTDPLPDTAQEPLHRGDIVLMCSDGLSGVVPDTPTENYEGSIDAILAADYNDLTAARTDLMKAAENNNWYDNLTVLLCRVDGDLPLAVPQPAEPSAAPEPASAPAPAPQTAPAKAPETAEQPAADSGDEAVSATRKKSHTALWIIGAALLLGAVAAAGYWFFNSGEDKTYSDMDAPNLEKTTSGNRSGMIKALGEDYETNRETTQPEPPQAIEGQPAEAIRNETGQRDLETSTPAEQPATGTIASHSGTVTETAAQDVTAGWKGDLINRLRRVQAAVEPWKNDIDNLIAEIKSAGDDHKQILERRTATYETRRGLWNRLTAIQNNPDAAEKTRNAAAQLKERLNTTAVAEAENKVAELERQIVPQRGNH